MTITETIIIYAPSQTKAYAKVKSMYKNRKNLRLNYMHRISNRKYEANISYQQYKYSNEGGKNK